MGSQVKSICKCEYEKDSLIGGGMLNFKTTEYFPCLCKDCNELVQGNLKAKILECPDCNKSKIIPYNNKILIGNNGSTVIAHSSDNVLTDGFYKCPKCQEMTLKFFTTGIIWD